jgi:uncharacterized protein YrzB (UPF0473 family)
VNGLANEENENFDEPELIYIADEEGNDEEFEVIMKFEVDDTGKKYMMVVPYSEEDEGEGEGEEEEVYAFRYEEDGDDLTLFTIDDEAEWEIVEETFHTLLDEMEEED